MNPNMYYLKLGKKKNWHLKSPKQFCTRLNYLNNLNSPELQKIADLPIIAKLTITFKLKPKSKTDLNLEYSMTRPLKSDASCFDRS